MSTTLKRYKTVRQRLRIQKLKLMLKMAKKDRDMLPSNPRRIIKLSKETLKEIFPLKSEAISST